MAGKSRRGRGRYVPRSKRKKGQGAPVPSTQPAVAAPQAEPSPRADAPVPSAKAPTPKAAVAAHTDVATELRRIGIIAGIMLVILVVLALIIS